MKPRVTVITLGVDDLERAVRFYRDGLSLPTHDIRGTAFEHRTVAFFDLQAGLRLALWPRQSIADDAMVRIIYRGDSRVTPLTNVPAGVRQRNPGRDRSTELGIPRP